MKTPGMGSRSHLLHASNYAARTLGVTIRRTELFPAVAKALGKPWIPGNRSKEKARGRALVLEFFLR